MPTFGQNFRAVLRKRGLTQAEAAKLLSTAQSVISYYSNLDGPPRRGTLLNIADRLGVSVEELTADKIVQHPENRHPSGALSTQGHRTMKLFDNAMKKLKMRWKKKTHERDTIKHLIAALFPGDSDSILNWFDEP